jgi:EmrB/QacA subfamily drug resistance transporter
MWPEGRIDWIKELEMTVGVSRQTNAQRQIAVGSDRRPWSILVLLAVAQFMVIVDITVVNVALPSIGRALHVESAADLQWVLTTYVLVSGGLQLLGGRAADLLGRRRMFLVGLTIFTAASLGSGLAPSLPWLILARGVQGLGAAVMAPAALSIISTFYTGGQRAVALGAWGAIGAGGAAAGVLLGGVLTSWLGWSWVFFINVPVGVIATALTMRIVLATPAAPKADVKLDVAGAAIVVAAPLLLVSAIASAATSGWTSPRVLIQIVLVPALLTAFVVIERVAPNPLIAPAIWKVRSLMSSAIVMLGATALMAGAFFLNSIYLQRVLGASALETGLAFLPFVVAIGLAAHVGSRLLAHVGTRLTATGGLLVATAGMLLLARVPPHPIYAADLLPGFFALGIGLGLVFVSVSVAAMADIRDKEAGLASGLMITGHEIGAALGVAVLSGITTASIGAATTTSSFATGFRVSLLIAGIFAAVLAVLALVTMPSVRPTGGSQVRIH